MDNAKDGTIVDLSFFMRDCAILYHLTSKLQMLQKNVAWFVITHVIRGRRREHITDIDLEAFALVRYQFAPG
jgi:hypothetical protein